MDKLYIVVDKALNAGLKMAQACHALRMFVEAYPELDRHWYETSNNIVILEHTDVPAIAHDLKSLQYSLVIFREPDLDDAVTAICVEPRAERVLSNMRLAG